MAYTTGGKWSFRGDEHMGIPTVLEARRDGGRERMSQPGL